MKYFLFLLLFSLTMICCNNGSDDDSPMGNLMENAPRYLIHKIYRGGILNVERNYSSDSILTSQTIYQSNGDLFLLQNYSSLNDTIVAISMDADNDTTQLRYSYLDNNTNARVDRFEPDGVLDNYTVYTFSNDSCGYTTIEFFNPDNTISRTVEIEYIDGNCSYSTDYFDGAGDLLFSEIIIKDNTNIGSSKLTDLFQTSKQGNTLEYTIKDVAGNIVESSSYVTEYEYNQFGYITSGTTTYLDGNTVENTTYEYW